MMPWLAQYLECWANQVAARYGFPVYIVGSALTDADPRDVDIVCILPDEHFANRFGPADPDGWVTEYMKVGDTQRRWAREVAKFSRECTIIHRAINVDFKVQPQMVADGFDGQRVRIDTVSLEDDAEGAAAVPLGDTLSLPCSTEVLTDGGENCGDMCGGTVRRVDGVYTCEKCGETYRTASDP